MWTGEQRNFTPDTLEYVNGTPKDGSGGRKTYVFRQSRTGNRRQGAVESGFQERSPTIGPAVRTTLVVLANAGHP